MRLYEWQIVCAVHCITTTVKLYKSKFMHNVTQYSKSSRFKHANAIRKSLTNKTQFNQQSIRKLQLIILNSAVFINDL